MCNKVNVQNIQSIPENWKKNSYTSLSHSCALACVVLKDSGVLSGAFREGERISLRNMVHPNLF